MDTIAIPKSIDEEMKKKMAKKMAILNNLNREIVAPMGAITTRGMSEDQARVEILNHLKILSITMNTEDGSLEMMINNYGRTKFEPDTTAAFAIDTAIYKAFQELSSIFSEAYSKTLILSNIRHLAGGHEVFNTIVGYVNPLPMPPVPES